MNDRVIKRVRDNNIVVDKNAIFKGISVKNLGGFGRRKLENLLIIENHQKMGGVPKIRYE